MLDLKFKILSQNEFNWICYQNFDQFRVLNGNVGLKKLNFDTFWPVIAKFLQKMTFICQKIALLVISTISIKSKLPN